MDLTVSRVKDPAALREIERLKAMHEDNSAMIDYLSLMLDVELPTNTGPEDMEAAHE